MSIEENLQESGIDAKSGKTDAKALRKQNPEEKNITRLCPTNAYFTRLDPT